MQACHLKIEHSEFFKNSPSKIEDIKNRDILIHYVGSAAKNKLIKIMMFDKLQEQYNELLHKVYPEEKGFTIPDNSFFDKLEDENKKKILDEKAKRRVFKGCLLYTSPSPRDS